MAILKSNYGKHKDVTIISLGFGDVKINQAKHAHKYYHVTFSDDEPHPIGEEDEGENAGKSTDVLDNVKAVISFSNPESITVLIHSLAELQTEMFKDSKKIKSCIDFG